MEKISVSKVVESRRKTENSKITLINNLKKSNQQIDSEGGGDYWVTSNCAISNYFKSEDSTLINEKIDDLVNRADNANAKISKTMYQRNIEILYGFEDFDFSNYKPVGKLNYLAKPMSKSIMKINDLPIQVRPSHVYSFVEGNNKKIGAIWFISKLKGYRLEEISLYTDVLFRYLEKHYTKEYVIGPKYGIAMDVVNRKEIRYNQILMDDVTSPLNSTIEMIKKLL
ncbi:hypothetical protein [Echinicola rosea]|uniref:Uncharacterized protein n=1 Tax=Echinicola rosea TaxID=1807691 RepID=A0ABQ1V9T8_9BACT|nr:hypothetical protein [Echinicola rosea]GGF44255.1 hypothetical protein GCM10011339_35940 [Echinicola rosea]